MIYRLRSRGPCEEGRIQQRTSVSEGCAAMTRWHPSISSRKPRICDIGKAGSRESISDWLQFFPTRRPTELKSNVSSSSQHLVPNSALLDPQNQCPATETLAAKQTTDFLNGICTVATDKNKIDINCTIHIYIYICMELYVYIYILYCLQDISSYKDTTSTFCLQPSTMKGYQLNSR